MTARLHKPAALAIIAFCALAAGAPPETQKLRKPAAGRSAPAQPGSQRRPAKSAGPVQSVGVTVVVRPRNEPEAGPPLTFYLGQSRPNPFYRTTTIALTNPSRAHAQLVMYDVQGHKVATLLDTMLDPGDYFITWAGTDDNGRTLPPGVYMYELAVGRHHSIRKVVFIH